MHFRGKGNFSCYIQCLIASIKQSFLIHPTAFLYGCQVRKYRIANQCWKIKLYFKSNPISQRQALRKIYIFYKNKITVRHGLPTIIIIIIEEMRIIVSLWNTIPSDPYRSWPCLPSTFACTYVFSFIVMLEFSIAFSLGNTLKYIISLSDWTSLFFNVNYSI